jgi:hypothetical protein
MVADQGLYCRTDSEMIDSVVKTWGLIVTTMNQMSNNDK